VVGESGATEIRKALVIATGLYLRAGLSNLESPARDAELCERVLSNPALGGFHSVNVLLNAEKSVVENELWEFSSTAQPDDLLFVYFSCHGRKDRNGHLYLATTDTIPERLPPTAVSADRVRDWFDDSPAGRLITVFDCCYAGAFAGELRQRNNRERVAILTTSAVEKAHEGRGLLSNSGPSAFARAFFGGIEGGQADYDYNGSITIREAFTYATGRLKEERIAQSPQMRAGIAGDIEIARAPITPGSLTKDLRNLVQNNLPAARELAVSELGRWLVSGDADKSKTADEALRALSNDHEPIVADAATKALLLRTDSTDHLPFRSSTTPLTANPLWFKRAIFYEVRVRSFSDSNGDGVGDLRGLMSRLNYIKLLGADCLILSPVYASPLNNDGFDISDYQLVHPDSGDMSEFELLIDEAHREGIRVVLDIVLNHTSVEHKWFQSSRSLPSGPYGDYYVWHDSDERYADAESTQPEEATNWTYDRRRKQYYWHRYSPSEPDLNFDSSAVQDEVLKILEFWLSKGVDGFRLLTAPYLYERDGSASVGLDETHQFLRRLRSSLDAKWSDRILIAWADTWPSDASTYFGSSDEPECNIVLYTSLIPHIFLAMKREDSEPFSSLLRAASQIPESAQWGLYLRNGDEMTLDLVDEIDRAYLMDSYAPNPTMRTPCGIRRRLAPLLDGDRGQLDLCMALLLSLPGAPILYYGDEIGMGENLSLIGSSSVRTPMQWSSERSGGFSTAEQEALSLPVLLSSIYGYQATNVESQLRNSKSLLQTIRRLIENRRRSDALSIGDLSEIPSSSPAVFAYLRKAGDEQILCVVNFSRYAVATELDLSVISGLQPVEMIGRAPFPVVGPTPYVVSLVGHGYYWLECTQPNSFSFPVPK
jgi:trehalose synthase